MLSKRTLCTHIKQTKYSIDYKRCQLISQSNWTNISSCYYPIENGLIVQVGSSEGDAEFLYDVKLVPSKRSRSPNCQSVMKF